MIGISGARIRSLNVELVALGMFFVPLIRREIASGSGCVRTLDRLKKNQVDLDFSSHCPRFKIPFGRASNLIIVPFPPPRGCQPRKVPKRINIHDA